MTTKLKGRSSDTEASMDRSFGEQDDVFGEHDGALVGPGQQLPATLEARALVRARSVKMAWPPAWRQRIPERFIRWVASVLHAASTIPEPMGRFCACACA